MSRRGRTPTRAQRRREKAKKKKPPISLLALILGIATLTGGVGAAATFLPRVTPSISDPVDPKNAFSSSITLTNTGYLPLHAVGVSIGLRFVCGGPGVQGKPCPDPNTATLRTLDYETRLESRLWPRRDMSIDDRFTVTLGEILGPWPHDILAADLAVIVSYTIPIIHWQREKTFPVAAHKQSDGRIYWYWK